MFFVNFEEVKFISFVIVNRIIKVFFFGWWKVWCKLKLVISGKIIDYIILNMYIVMKYI